ncbi:ORF024 [Saltwater crocodilepox virus]|nr:ORF024 [Saltwater crocodilepox virus]QGT49034.1 ORF024 [Saltwater crocodilepox virus]
MDSGGARFSGDPPPPALSSLSLSLMPPSVIGRLDRRRRQRTLLSENAPRLQPASIRPAPTAKTAKPAAIAIPSPNRRASSAETTMTASHHHVFP